MATRFYFSYSIVPPVSPAIDAGWDYTAEFSREPWASPGLGDALAQALTIGPLSGTAGHKGISGQYISDPLEAQTISGTVKGQILAAEVAGTDNINQIIIVLKVVSNDGTTVRGTCLALGSYGPTAEFSAGSSVRNKKIADGDTITSVDAQAGDRLVLEIGASNSVSGTTPEFFFRVGDDATDLPEDETTTTDLAGWFEFSDDITFQTAGQTVAIGQITETDTPQAVGRLKTRAVAQTEETATAQALTRLKARVLGQILETDTAGAVAWAPKHRLVAQASETDTVTTLGRAKVRGILGAVETDTAQVITPTTPGVIVVPVGQVTESDTSQVLAKLKVRLIGQVTETDTSGILAEVKGRTLGQASEVDTATALLVLQAETWRIIRPSAAASVTSSGSGTIDPPTGSAVTGPGGGTIDPPTSPPITVP